MSLRRGRCRRRAEIGLFVVDLEKDEVRMCDFEEVLVLVVFVVVFEELLHFARQYRTVEEPSRPESGLSENVI